MITDIFSNRYTRRRLWESHTENDKRFLVQAFKIVSEQLIPYYNREGNENPANKATWKSIHDKLSMELGVDSLWERAFSYRNQAGGVSVSLNTYEAMCRKFCHASPSPTDDVDRFIKDRISLIEVAFREKYNEIIAANQKLPSDIVQQRRTSETIRVGIKLPGDIGVALTAINKQLNDAFTVAAEELNIRIQQAGYPLNYHNGFIQIASDELISAEIDRPFWVLLADDTWKNVDLDMKEAIDRRDNGGRDAAFFAARALESVIKIVSSKRDLTTGKEKGAHNYIDNLSGNRAGNFIAGWEREILKTFFTEVRNPLGHGAGDRQTHALTQHQTAWAIEFCMSWIKSLITR